MRVFEWTHRVRLTRTRKFAWKKKEEEKEIEYLVYIYIFLTTRVLPSKTLNPLNIVVSFLNDKRALRGIIFDEEGEEERGGPVLTRV